MSRQREHAEDIEHELEHAGREVADSFLDSITEPEDAEDTALLDATDD